MIHKTINFTDGRKLEIIQDESPESPRDWDNLGTMVCWHTRYKIGDDHEIRHEDFSSWDAIEQHLRDEHDAAIILPIYMYDHSGQAFSTVLTYPFTDRWDAGQVGFIFISKTKLIEEYGNDSDETRQKVHGYLNGEVETYNRWSNGDVWGFVVREKPCETCGGPGEESDSCWGFYGDDPAENGMSDNLDEAMRTAIRDGKFEEVSA